METIEISLTLQGLLLLSFALTTFWLLGYLMGKAKELQELSKFLKSLELPLEDEPRTKEDWLDSIQPTRTKK